jgi:hypothetical protein
MVNCIGRFHLMLKQPFGERANNDEAYDKVLGDGGGISGLVPAADKAMFSLDAHVVILAAMDLDMLMRRACPLYMLGPRVLSPSMKRHGIPMSRSGMKIHPDGRARQHNTRAPVSLLISPSLRRLGRQKGLAYKVDSTLQRALVLTATVEGQEGDEEDSEEEEDVEEETSRDKTSRQEGGQEKPEVPSEQQQGRNNKRMEEQQGVEEEEEQLEEQAKEQPEKQEQQPKDQEARATGLSAVAGAASEPNDDDAQVPGGSDGVKRQLGKRKRSKSTTTGPRKKKTPPKSLTAPTRRQPSR